MFCGQQLFKLSVHLIMCKRSVYIYLVTLIKQRKITTIYSIE